MSAVPVADGLFTWPSESPQLIGSTCPECGATTFPRQGSCPRCPHPSMEERLLSTRGTLWTFTVQGFEPKPPYRGPVPFEPYGVGYVELRGEVMVESRLTVSDPDQLEIGQEMELVVVPFRSDESGDDVVTFAFRPATAGSGS
jgi:uncharacterized protein